MVNIKTYKEYWESIVTKIEGLKASYLIATEPQLKDKINDVADFPILVATVPSAGPASRDSDNTAKKNSGLIFILKKVSSNDRTDDLYITYMEEMQNVIDQVEKFMIYDQQNCESPYHAMMERLDVNSFNLDPEYNYLGCDGWSLSFKFVTD